MHTQLQLATQKYRRGRVVSLATPRSSTGMAIASLMDMNPYNLISANSRKRIKPQTPSSSETERFFVVAAELLWHSVAFALRLWRW